VRTQSSKRQRISGVSLIELMVAMAIGVVLVLGLVQIFSASRAAFASAEGMSRVQENARFAIDIMRNDLRMVGHLGLRGELGYLQTGNRFFNHAAAPSTTPENAPFALRLDMPLIAFEHNNTSPSQVLNLSGGVGTGVGAGSFVPALPGALGDLAGDAIVGSDVLVLRFLGGEFVSSVRLQQSANSLVVDNPLDVPFFQREAIYGLANQRAISLFQARSAGPVVAAGTGGVNVSNWTPAEDGFGRLGSVVHRYEYAVYYVGLDAASGQPSLRTRRLDVSRPDLLSTPLTLIEGIESMQLMFGVDTGVGVNRDDVMDNYFTAAGVTLLDADPRAAWSRVMNVRVALLMRSSTPGASVRDASSPPLRAADTTITVANDGRLRQVYETSITLRNRARN
jgi:type IV pilus assembly protein PilW